MEVTGQPWILVLLVAGSPLLQCSSPTATPIAPGDVSVSASYWRSTEFVDVHYHICLDVESGDLNFMLVHQVPYTLSHLPQLSSSF